VNREVEEVEENMVSLNTFVNHIHARQTLVDFISESDIQKINASANRYLCLGNNAKKIKEASKQERPQAYQFRSEETECTNFPKALRRQRQMRRFTTALQRPDVPLYHLALIKGNA
jgi:flagellar motility protein MotE (MotC chaperone)